MKRIAALLLLVALVPPPAARAGDNPLAVARNAHAAYEAGRWGEAADLYLAFTRLLPRSPAGRIAAARALARAGRTAEALEQLAKTVAFGVRFDPADAAFATIRENAAFQRLASAMRARTEPLVRSTVTFRLEKDLTPENVAWDPKTGAFFVGSMYKAKILRIAPDGAVSDFVPPRHAGLLSVVGMKVDPARRELWAAAGNFGERPPMEVDDPATRGHSALFRFHADSGELLGTYSVPPAPPAEPVQFNDLVLTPAGDVYATAGPAGVWRLRRGETRLEQLFARDSFLNGITITPDGKTLFVASHLEGVLKVDAATGTASLVGLPDGATLGGIDGLYLHEGSLVAIQNGTDPIRVVRAWLDPAMTRVTRLAVLEQEHPESDIPLTGTVVGDHLYYVARSQLRAFEGKTIWPAERLKETTILKLPLELTSAPAPDLEAEKAALLEMHAGEIRAHLGLDAAWLAATHGDDFASASRGAISRSTGAETLAFFTKYFEGASYLQYEDVEPPIVRVSDDGSLGWILSRTRVRRVQEGTERSFVYAGMMAYEKRDGRWIRVANASTFEE